MSDGAAKLLALLDKLSAIEKLAEEAAPLVAEELESDIRKSISAGTSFGGVPWTPKKDGGKPLQNAGSALTVDVFGTQVVATIEGIEAKHHKGAVRGNTGGNTLIRPILPTSKSMGTVAKTVRRAVVKKFGEIL